MITDLDETLKQLLINRAQLDPAEVDISFDIPTRDWSTPVTRPTVNLYLYDIRENRQLRETYWDEEVGDQGRAILKRRPLRIDLSYMLTCWANATEDQHRLLWRVLETLFRNSPLPDEVLQGRLKELTHPIRSEVAQPDGILKNVSDFWGALENQLRPAVSVVFTLDLDMEQFSIAPLVFARALKLGHPLYSLTDNGREVMEHDLEPGWDVPPLRLGGEVRSPQGEGVPGASVRLVGRQPDGPPVQVGPTVQTDPDGRYIFSTVQPGEYTLVVEVAGRPPIQHTITVAVGSRGQLAPDLIDPVEVSME